MDPVLPDYGARKNGRYSKDDMAYGILQQLGRNVVGFM